MRDDKVILHSIDILQSMIRTDKEAIHLIDADATLF
jgi:hypothetical protein